MKNNRTAQTKDRPPSSLSLPTRCFASCDALGLYAIVDSLEWLQCLLPLGLGAIQLRVKDLTSHQAKKITARAVDIVRPYRTRLFINDYWRQAVECGAYGVHLGQQDLNDADLHAIYSAGLRLGISTHSEHEWHRALRIAPSYIALGTVFPTTTKPAIVIGVAQLAKWVALLKPHIPLVAIGGITLNNVPRVLATGVDSVAVASAITKARCYEHAIVEFNRHLNNKKNET